jgi:dTDP-4-dehydrorhamnose 3,5-epimerase
VTPEAEVVYKTTEEYAPDREDGLRWDDPGLAIRWPVSNPFLSERDRRWPTLAAMACPV